MATVPGAVRCGRGDAIVANRIPLGLDSVGKKKKNKEREETEKNVMLTCGSHMLSQLVEPGQDAISAKPLFETAEGVKLHRF